MKRLSFTLALVSILSLLGCGGGSSGGSTTPVLQSISLTPSAPSVAVGLTQQFTATGSYSDGSSKNLTGSVTWNSSTPATATISASGLATSVAVGTTTVSARSGGISGSTVLTVPATLVSLVVTPPSVQIAATTATSFTATGTFNDGSVKNVTSSVTWSSADTTIATISSTTPTQGAAMGVAAGTVIITATGTTATGSTSGTASLKVTSATLTSIAVTPAAMSIPLGVQQQFTATGTFSDMTTQDITGTVTWASSAPSIASITVSGLATGLKIGSTTISATAGAVSGSTSLTVNAANLASLAVTPGNPGNPAQIAANTAQQFSAVGTFNDGSTKNLTGQAAWTSSNTAVSTIGPSNGLAKALTSGSTTISATVGSITTPVTLTVSTATVTSITVTPTGRSIAPRSKLAFTATGTFSDTTTQVITSSVVWASQATSVATIAAGGTATAVAAGTTNITATFNSVVGTAPLTVTGATLSSIAITPTSTVLAPASTLIYQATGTYSDGSTQNISNVVIWTSAKPSVVSITAAGQATGQSAGSTTIQAQLGSVSKTSAVVVESSALQTITVSTPVSNIPVQVGAQYTAIAGFADGSTQDITSSVTWTSSKSSVATISNSAGTAGLAVGVSPGSTTITAAFGGVVGTATLTVNSAALQTVTVTPSSPNIALGTSQQFTANASFNDGTSFNVSNQVAWTSSNVNVAVISGGGLANSAAVGTSTIKATLGATSGMTVLTVH